MATVTSTDPSDPATGASPAPEPPHVVARNPAALRRNRWHGCLPWLFAIMAIVAAVTYWKYPAFKAQAELGSAYAARIGCSCRYVQGRSLESCQTDFEPGMDIVSVSEDPATKSVTGSVPLLATRTARFAGPSGCLLDSVD